MNIQIAMDNFPMLLFEMFTDDLNSQGIQANIQVGGEDTVFVHASLDDVVKAQVLVILCDKYRFAKGGKLTVSEGGETDV